MTNDDKHVKALEKIGNILAHLLLNGMGESDLKTKVKVLRGCGFSNHEIAEMVHSTVNSVKVAFSMSKAKRKK